MELMDTKWAFASAVRRAKDYMSRTGRISLESKRDTKYGFDKDVVTCLTYGEKGHFKRECTRSSKQGNNNPFQNQSSSSNINHVNNEKSIVAVNNPNDNPFQNQLSSSNTNNVNNERSIVAVNNPNNSNKSGPSNSNKFKQMKDVIEQFSKDDDSSGYNGSSDEKRSSAGGYGSDSDVKEGTDVEVDSLLSEAEELKSQKSVLIRKAEVASKEMEKFFTEDGSFSYQTAFMANVATSTSQSHSRVGS
ncbi:putative transcription factor interactor and regulator CCHC(Zn) family [Helianthus anomalus]